MFIKVAKSGYNRHGEQFAQGLFLILMQPKYDGLSPSESVKATCNAPIRAIVRFVKMSQFGPWMMGKAWIKGHRLILSGSYGQDGLICDVPPVVYEEGVDLPTELYDAWNHGGGWNSAGSEAGAMRQWALDNLDKLYKVRR